MLKLLPDAAADIADGVKAGAETAPDANLTNRQKSLREQYTRRTKSDSQIRTPSPTELSSKSILIGITGTPLTEINTIIRSRMKNITARARGTSYFIAEKFLEILRTRLHEGDPLWPLLSKSWVEIKRDKGWWLGPWIATGELVSYIGIYPLPDGRGYFVGFDPHATHRGSGLPAWKLGEILEFGVPELGIPARSLFRRSRNELKQWYRDLKKAPPGVYTG